MGSLSKIELSILGDIYGGLLTDKQRYALSMYCDLDCSLGEVAGEAGISRQGVRAALMAAESSLIKLESVLHVAERKCKLNLYLADITDASEKGDIEKIKKLTRELASSE